MEDYYQRNPAVYHEKTFHIDPSLFLKPLIRQLKPGHNLLDVGCGSGRDLRWLKAHGFKVTGFERSNGLAALARVHADCEIIEGDFQIFDFSKLSFDALLLCGCLVHVPHEHLEVAFKKIVEGLKSDGTLLVSLKQGDGSSTDAYGRRFYLWQDSHLQDIFAGQGFRLIDFHKTVSKVNEKDIWLSYILRKGLEGAKVPGAE